jgi:hypothetical protein
MRGAEEGQVIGNGDERIQPRARIIVRKLIDPSLIRPIIILRGGNCAPIRRTLEVRVCKNVRDGLEDAGASC